MNRRWGSLAVAPLQPDDAEWATRLDTAIAGPETADPDAGPPAAWARLWDDAIPLVGRIDGTAEPSVLISLYAANRTSGTIALGAAVPTPVRRTGIPARAIGLVIDELFLGWRVRLVHLEVRGSQLDAVRTAIGPLFEEEGRLPRHYRNASGAPPGTVTATDLGTDTGAGTGTADPSATFDDKVLLAVRRERWFPAWHDVVVEGAAGHRRAALAALIRARDAGRHQPPAPAPGTTPRARPGSDPRTRPTHDPRAIEGAR